MLSVRLRALRKEKKLTQAGLAERLGLTQQAVAKWEGALSFPEPAVLARLAGFFGVSADYLLGLAGTFVPAGPFAGVRIIGTVKAGYGGLAWEEELGEAPAAVEDPRAYRYLVVRGDSMAPLIRQGDLALVKLQPVLRDGELGVFLYGDEEATLKKFRRRDGAVILEAFNKRYKPVIIRGPELGRLVIVGRVVETRSQW